MFKRFITHPIVGISLLMLVFIFSVSHVVKQIAIWQLENVTSPINQTPMVGEVTSLGHYDLFCNRADLLQDNEGKQSGSCSFNYFYPVIGGDQLINQNITIKIDEHFRIGGQEWIFRGHHNGRFLFDMEKDDIHESNK